MAFHFSRRKLRPREEESGVGELNIVPYLDIMMNLIMFMLLSMTGLVTFGVLNVSAPKYASGPTATQANEDKKVKLLLTVLVSEKGFFIAGEGGVLPGEAAPVASSEGQPTIPRTSNGEYNYSALTAKMVEIKRAFPDESKVILGADATIPYEVLVQTMDACRENDGRTVEGKPEALFFDVSLTVM